MKRIIAMVLAIMMFTSMITFAEGNEIVVVYDLGYYKIVAEKTPMAGPRGTVYVHTNYGVIDEDGNEVVEQKYDQILPPSEGRSAFLKDGGIGFFDEDWNICIENKYCTNVYPIENRILFSEGLVAVAKRDESRYMVWGYIDRDGNEVIDFVYDSALPFENGLAKVGINEYVYNYNTKLKSGMIDKEGNIVEPFKFAYAMEDSGEYALDDTIQVQLSQNLVSLNGNVYKNSDIEYPFINYLGYSYIPLTYYGCRMLGINCDWTEEDGVMLEGGGMPAEDIIGDSGMVENVYEDARFYQGKLTINGKVYECGDTAYPLIDFRDVVYMPVLWQTGMEELGIEYSYTLEPMLENTDRGCMIFETQNG